MFQNFFYCLLDLNYSSPPGITMAGHHDPVLHPMAELVSLVRHSKTTFLDLPREICDEIYYHGLHASEPLIPYRRESELLELSDDHSLFDDEVSEELLDEIHNEPPQLAALATGLFWCNRQVSREARRGFYGCNTFRQRWFKPGQNWTRLLTFLSSIGDTNRRHLRHLRVSHQRCNYAYENDDGTLYQKGFDPSKPWDEMDYKVYLPPEARASPRQPRRHDGKLELLEPAMHACFRLLGADGPKVKMVLEPCRVFPGDVVLDTEKRLDEMALLLNNGERQEDMVTTYVPRMLERFAKEETAGRVQVVWKSDCREEAFLERREGIKKAGWEFLDVKYGPHVIFTARWQGEESFDSQGMTGLSIR